MRYSSIEGYVDKVSVANEELVKVGTYATCFDIIPSGDCTLILFDKELPLKAEKMFSIPHQDGFMIKSLKIKESGVTFTLYLGIVIGG